MDTVTILSLHGDGDAGGAEVSLRRVPLALFGSVGENLRDLLVGHERGAARDDFVAQAMVAQTAGSWTLEVLIPSALLASGIAQSFKSDIAAMAARRQNDIVDPARRKAFRQLQKEFHAQGAVGLRMGSPAFAVGEFAVEEEAAAEDAAGDGLWMDSERFLLATVMDLGGKKKVSTKLRLDDGTDINAASDREYLGGLTENVLYKRVRAHVAYRINLATMERRDYRLLGLAILAAAFDEQGFDAVASRPSKWDAIADHVAYVRELRGQ